MGLAWVRPFMYLLTPYTMSKHDDRQQPDIQSAAFESNSAPSDHHDSKNDDRQVSEPAASSDAIAQLVPADRRQTASDSSSLDRTQTDRIADLNDRLRDEFDSGSLIITSGVWSLGHHAVFFILGKVRRFSDFTSDNDPHGERDFDAFEQGGRNIMWKIDYYDREMEYGSPDPADPYLTTRRRTHARRRCTWRRSGGRQLYQCW